MFDARLEAMVRNGKTGTPASLDGHLEHRAASTRRRAFAGGFGAVMEVPAPYP